MSVQNALRQLLSAGIAIASIQNAIARSVEAPTAADMEVLWDLMLEGRDMFPSSEEFADIAIEFLDPEHRNYFMYEMQSFISSFSEEE